MMCARVTEWNYLLLVSVFGLVVKIKKGVNPKPYIPSGLVGLCSMPHVYLLNLLLFPLTNAIVFCACFYLTELELKDAWSSRLEVIPNFSHHWTILVFYRSESEWVYVSKRNIKWAKPSQSNGAMFDLDGKYTNPKTRFDGFWFRDNRKDTNVNR